MAKSFHRWLICVGEKKNTTHQTLWQPEVTGKDQSTSNTHLFFLLLSSSIHLATLPQEVGAAGLGFKGSQSWEEWERKNVRKMVGVGHEEGGTLQCDLRLPADGSA
jgi:hypothetical protein